MFQIMLAAGSSKTWRVEAFGKRMMMVTLTDYDSTEDGAKLHVVSMSENGSARAIVTIGEQWEHGPIHVEVNDILGIDIAKDPGMLKMLQLWAMWYVTYGMPE